MTVRVERTGDILRLRFEGDDALDYVCAPRAKIDALAWIDGSADIVIDLSEIDFVDSAGLGVLVGIYRAVQKVGREARFAGVRPSVAKLMRIIKLDAILPIETDVSSAVESLERRSA